jgi:DNA-binding response OmpR family regulator
MVASTSPLVVPAPLDIVVLCPEPNASQYRGSLQATGRVSVTASTDVAIEYVARTKSPLLIVDADQDHDAAEAACRRATQLVPERPAVLVTLSKPEAAAQFIDVCDSILLKPFAPNLLAGRVARLLRQPARDARQRSSQSRERALLQAKDDRLSEGVAVGALIAWPGEHCPHCQHVGIILFDYASLRRAWYACRGCRKVWLARRLE